jgi:ribosomal protein S18 acetylase RimI-like enzyme
MVRLRHRRGVTGDGSPLATPVWSALTTDHAHLAEVCGAARRYPARYAPFAAFDEPGAWDDLRPLVPPGDVVALVTAAALEVPPDWAVARRLTVDQMALDLRGAAATPDGAVLELTDADGPEMLALALAAEPGPFRDRTHRLGRFLGVRDAGRLVAMAGERMRVPGHTEISAVCTRPAFRGRGLAAGLMRALVAGHAAEGRGSFLHVTVGNPARTVYERLGFRPTRSLEITVLGVAAA